MKKTMLIFAVLSMLVMAGCAPSAPETGGKAEAMPKNTGDAGDAIHELNSQLDKLAVQLNPIVEYEANTVSRAMINSALKKVSDFDKKISEAEDSLDEVEKLQFNGKQEYVSANRQFISVLKEISAMYRELYEFSLEIEEKNALDETENKAEELLDAIVNCRCDNIDCEAYMESTIGFIDKSIEIFRRAERNYGFEVVGDVADSWESEKAVHEEHWPGLIEKSGKYGDRCYRISDAYDEYLKDLHQVDEVAETEISDAVSEKWLIHLMDKLAEMENAALDVDNARAAAAS